MTHRKVGSVILYSKKIIFFSILSKTTYAILIAVIILAILIVAVVAITTLYRRMRVYQNRHKGLERQMQNIEEKVTMVARRAYHELNLDICDLQNEVREGMCMKNK